MNNQEFTETMGKVDAVHKVLEDLTPPEALEVLVMVSKNLKAEIRDKVQDDMVRFLTDHLWIEDGDRVVCTECGLDLEDWKKGEPHVE